MALVCALATTTAASAQTPAEWQDVIRNLRHPSAQTRLNAINRLGEAGYVAAADAVAPLVDDPDDRVQLAAIDAELTFFLVDRVSGGGWSFGGGGGKSRAQQAFEAGPLLRSAAPAPPVLLDHLIAAMRDDNARVRFDAIHALGFIAQPPLADAQVKALAAELDHYDPIMRAATARVLGRLHATGAADALAVALTDSNVLVRQYATEALGLLHDAKSAPVLRDQVLKSRGDTLAVSVLALARIGSADDVGLFRQHLIDRVPELRRAAAEGLGRAGDRDAIRLLEPLLKDDKSAEVRVAAAFGLQKLGQTQSQVIASMVILPEVGGQARDYLLELGAPAIPGILATLKVATDSRHRADLIQILGYVGTRDDVPSVDPFLKDGDDRVRRAAVQAITRLRR